MEVSELAKSILAAASFAFLALALIAGLYRLLALASASAKIRRSARSLRSVDYRRFQDSEHVMPVSLIVPAIAEQGDINDCLNNLLSLEFKQYEVIVAASSNNRICWEKLTEEYRLLPFRQPYKKTLLSDEAAVYRSAKDVRLIVLDHSGTNRASALNAGVNISAYPLVAIAYPDQLLSKNALLMAVYAFVGDPGCVYVGSFPRVGGDAGNRKGNAVFSQLQNIERLRTLFTRRSCYETLGMYLPRQASFGVFLKSAVTGSDGFFQESQAEQADLLLRIHERLRKEKITYQARLLPDAICIERPKQTLREVCTAASCAQTGMEDCLRRRNHAVRMLPGIRRTRAAERAWPIADLAGVLVVLASAAFGAVPLWFAALYLALPVLLSALQSACAVLMEESAFQKEADTELLLQRYLLALAESLGWRQCAALHKAFTRRRRRR